MNELCPNCHTEYATCPCLTFDCDHTVGPDDDNDPCLTCDRCAGCCICQKGPAMPHINQDHITEIAHRLQQGFRNQQQVMATAQGCLSQAGEDLQDLYNLSSAIWPSSDINELTRVCEELAQIRFACRTLQDTAALAEQGLLELLALVGVNLVSDTAHERSQNPCG